MKNARPARAVCALFRTLAFAVSAATNANVLNSVLASMLVLSLVESVIYCVRQGESQSTVEPETSKQLDIVTGDVRKSARRFRRN